MIRMTRDEIILRNTLVLHQTTLGEKHLDTANDMVCLADFLWNNPRSYSYEHDLYEEVEKLYQQAKSVYEQVPPRYYPYKDSRYEAQELYQQAKIIYEQILGPNHPKVIDCIDKLVKLFECSDEIERVRDYLTEKLDLEEQFFGSNHPKAANTLLKLGEMSITRHIDTEAAREFTCRALTIYERELGTEHSSTKAAYKQLTVTIPEIEKKIQDNYWSGLGSLGCLFLVAVSFLFIAVSFLFIIVEFLISLFL